LALIGSYDLVLDGSDNFETRYLVSGRMFLAGKPLITAALGVFDGSLTTIRAHERNAEASAPVRRRPGQVARPAAEARVMGALTRRSLMRAYCGQRSVEHAERAVINGLPARKHASETR